MADDQRSVSLWDLAPADGAAPEQFQVIASRAAELIAAFPSRYRLAVAGEVRRPSAATAGRSTQALKTAHDRAPNLRSPCLAGGGAGAFRRVCASAAARTGAAGFRAHPAITLSGTTCGCAVGSPFTAIPPIPTLDQVWINGVRNVTDATHGWSLSSPTGQFSVIPRPITDALLTFNAAQTGTVQIVGRPPAAPHVRFPGECWRPRTLA